MMASRFSPNYGQTFPPIAALDKGKGKARDTAASLAPLKVVIMSATLEAEKFSKFFNGWVPWHVLSSQRPC